MCPSRVRLSAHFPLLCLDCIRTEFEEKAPSLHLLHYLSVSLICSLSQPHISCAGIASFLLMLVFNFTFSILFSQIVPTSLARKAHSKTMSSNVDIKSSELSIAIQKKLLGKMVTNRCVAKRLIDDNSGRLLDYINQLIKLYRTEPNTVKQSSNPEKVVKNLIKVSQHFVELQYPKHRCYTFL